MKTDFILLDFTLYLRWTPQVFHKHLQNNVFKTSGNNKTKATLQDDERRETSDLIVSIRPQHGLFKKGTAKARVLSQEFY